MSEAAAERVLITHPDQSITQKSTDRRKCPAGRGRNRLHGSLANYDKEEPGLKSKSVPGFYRRINARCFDQTDAMEFMLANDDGINPKKNRKTKIIFRGVSRAGKTPLSIYWSMFGCGLPIFH